MAGAIWTDSALYNSSGGLLDGDKELKKYNKHKVHSQAHGLVGVMRQADLEKKADLPLSVLDWRSHFATKTVVAATLVAETAATSDGVGMT